MRVLILSSAEDDLREGFWFYESRQADVGEHFLQCLFRDIDALGKQAGVHRVEHGFHRRLCERFPCAIYYTLEDGLVRVWRILDLRRDPAWIRQQLGGL